MWITTVGERMLFISDVQFRSQTEPFRGDWGQKSRLNSYFETPSSETYWIHTAVNGCNLVIVLKSCYQNAQYTLIPHLGACKNFGRDGWKLWVKMSSSDLVGYMQPNLRYSFANRRCMAQKIRSLYVRRPQSWNWPEVDVTIPHPPRYHNTASSCTKFQQYRSNSGWIVHESRQFGPLLGNNFCPLFLALSRPNYV